MSQTEKGMTFVAAKVEVSGNGASWTDVSGHGASVAVGGGDRAVGKQHTFEGDTPILGPGKRDSVDLTIRFVYTEEDSEPFEVTRALYEAEGGYMYAKYSPKGGASTNFEYATGKGIIKSFGYPQGEAGDGAILLGQVVVTCAGITKSAI